MAQRDHRRIKPSPFAPIPAEMAQLDNAEHVVRSVDGGEAHCKIEFDWLGGVFK